MGKEKDNKNTEQAVEKNTIDSLEVKTNPIVFTNYKDIKFSLAPQPVDARDFKYDSSFKSPQHENDSFYLNYYMPQVFNQYSTSSCTANAIATCYQAHLKRNKQPPMIPSRLFLYWNERNYENSTNVDAGAYIRDGFKSLIEYGVCDESFWEFDADKVLVKPSEDAYRMAAMKTITEMQYRFVAQIEQAIEHAIASGYPIVIGIQVFDDLISDKVRKSGVLPMPAKGKNPIGGHAVVIMGYNRVDRTFLVRNSWGKEWGKSGNFTIPYDYVLDPSLAFDFCVLK